MSSASRRVAGQADAVRAAPLGDRLIERLLQAGCERPVVVASVPRSVRLIRIPQGRQMLREVVPQEGVDGFEDTGRSRDHAAFRPPGQQRRLIGEDRLDGLAEVLAELVVVPLVHVPDEAGDGLRIQDIGPRRLVLRHLPVVGPTRRVVLGEVQAANDRGTVARRPVDRRRSRWPFFLRRTMATRFWPGVSVGSPSPPIRTPCTSVCWLGLIQSMHTSPRVRKAGFSATTCPLDEPLGYIPSSYKMTHMSRSAARSIAKRIKPIIRSLIQPMLFGSPARGWITKAMYAVRPEILHLPEQFRLGQIVVPEPKRRLREFAGRVEPFVGQRHGLTLGTEIGSGLPDR